MTGDSNINIWDPFGDIVSDTNEKVKEVHTYRASQKRPVPDKPIIIFSFCAIAIGCIIRIFGGHFVNISAILIIVGVLLPLIVNFSFRKYRREQEQLLFQLASEKKWIIKVQEDKVRLKKLLNEFKMGLPIGEDRPHPYRDKETYRSTLYNQIWGQVAVKDREIFFWRGIYRYTVYYPTATVMTETFHQPIYIIQYSTSFPEPFALVPNDLVQKFAEYTIIENPKFRNRFRIVHEAISSEANAAIKNSINSVAQQTILKFASKYSIHSIAFKQHMILVSFGSEAWQPISQNQSEADKVDESFKQMIADIVQIADEVTSK